MTEEKVEVEVESNDQKEDESGERNAYASVWITPVPDRLPYVTLRGPIVYLKGCETFILLATCV